MSAIHNAALAAALLMAPLPAFAQGVVLKTNVLSEVREAAANGTTRIRLAPAARVTPGDRVVYQIGFKNTAKQAASNVVITNPVPAGLAYAGAAEGSPAPELSVDGVRFGTLSQLTVRAGGITRAATGADVRIVRWKLAPIAAGTSGQVSFRAILK